MQSETVRFDGESVKIDTDTHDDENNLTFVANLISSINEEDIENINLTQKGMLSKFEKTNEMLTNCNSLSSTYYNKLQSNFRRNTQLMHDMYKDFDYIFRSIRSMKRVLNERYCDAKGFINTNDQEDLKSNETDT